MNKNALFAIIFAIVLACISAFMPTATDDIHKILAYHWPNFFSLNDASAAELELEKYIYLRAAIYALLFLATLFFGYRWESSTRKKNEEKQRELDDKLAAHATKLTEQNEKSELVIKFLHTMPPKNYLSHFDKTFSFVSSLRYKIQNITATHPKTPEAKEAVTNACQAQIRAMNILLCELTGLWDAQGDGELPDMQYSVSVMFYYDTDDALEKFTNSTFSWGDSKKFFLATRPEGIKTDIDGVLFTEPKLSIKSLNLDLKIVVGNLKKARQNKEPDIPVYKDEKPFGLPVTLPEGAFRNQNIPGAPRSYALNEPQYISCCVDDMPKEIDAMIDIPPSMKNELKAYYANHKTIQSIVSFPLISPDGHKYGVLNISRSRKHLAKRNEFDFISLTKPIINLISDSIYSLVIYQVIPTPVKKEEA